MLEVIVFIKFLGKGYILCIGVEGESVIIMGFKENGLIRNSKYKIIFLRNFVVKRGKKMGRRN